MWNKILSVFFFIIISIKLAAAQDIADINIAKEYILAGEIAKAKESYATLAKKIENIRVIYADYLSIMDNNADADDKSKLIKKAIKIAPESINYKIDWYQFIKSTTTNKKTVEKEFDKLIKQIPPTPNDYELGGLYLMNQKSYDEAGALFDLGRKLFKNDFLFVKEVTELYQITKNNKGLVEELLSFLNTNPQQVNFVENSFQGIIEQEEDFSFLENTLYSYIQKYPEQIVYNELLYWMYVQKLNFTKALLQARAIDKRKLNDGKYIIELGKIALENKQYEDAIKILQVLNKQQHRIDYVDFAMNNIIYAKEEIIKRNYPVKVADIISLSTEYKNLMEKISVPSQKVEPLRKWALLKAFYLNNLDTAIVMLEDAIKLAGNNFYQRDLAKIDLGDIYVLNNEPWEAILLYYQVEKSQKEQPLGYEAKLRNAKASYYKGEFELAKEHLDVLKIATTREIANDALYLSLLIRDNLIEDSTGALLSAYSGISLLLYQNKYQQALDSLQAMLIQYPNSTLADDIYFDQAKIYRKIGKFDLAIDALKVVIKNYPEEMITDDALMLLANIYDENLKDIDKAKEVYQTIFVTYPNSVFSDQARKRFRILRGDKT